MSKVAKGISSSLSKENNTPFFATIDEDVTGGLLVSREDEYNKYDPEPNADQFLINSGATILHSEITITDSSGRNRTIVRRSDDD
jgi:hypothetical protein